MSLKIISSKNEFIKFWQEAKGKEFEKQLEIWNKVIESNNLDFCEKYFHGRDLFSDWEFKKIKAAKIALAEYPQIFEKIIEIFNNFDKGLDSHIKQFNSFFPDFNLDNTEVRIVVNLKRFLATLHTENGKTILMFSADNMASLQLDPLQVSGLTFKLLDSVLYSHELFHIYHTKNHPLKYDTSHSNHKLIDNIWSEGLAVFVSGKMNPNASMDEILGFEGIWDRYLLNKKTIQKEFQKDLNEVTSENFVAVDCKWRALSLKRDFMPFMSGYAIGYDFVYCLSQKYSLTELLSWDILKIEKELQTFLS